MPHDHPPGRPPVTNPHLSLAESLLRSLAEDVRGRADVIKDAIEEWRQESIDSVECVHQAEEMADELLALADRLAPILTPKDEPKLVIKQIACSTSMSDGLQQTIILALASDGSLWRTDGGPMWLRVPFQSLP